MNRRCFAAAVAASPWAGAQSREAGRVTVTGLEVFSVKVNRRGNWVLARIQTSAGVTGAGDASHGRPSDAATIGFLRSFFERLRGRGIFEFERLRKECEPEVLANPNAAATALSALDQCLWDIAGQVLGVPCYALFGGLIHRRIRNYANINRSTGDRSPRGFAAMAAKAVEAGFDAVKLAPFDGMPRRGDPATIEKFTRLGLDCCAAVREAIGAKNDLLVDGHNHFDLERGLELARRIEPLNLFWLEEVTPPDPIENLAAIKRAAKMPTAGGEGIYGIRKYLPYIAAGAVDIAMPDVKYCGGMLELKKIAALAEAAGMPVSPHGPASPVGNMAAAQVCAAMPNFQILEYSFGETSWREELVEPPERLDRGDLTVSDRPGLGLRLNDAALKRHAA